MKKYLQTIAIIFTLTTLGYSQWSWQNPLPQGNTLSSVKFISSTIGWAVGGGGTILSTKNGGISWSLQSSGTTNDLYSVSFTDANNGTAVGGGWNGTNYESIILRTTNGGSTWTLQSSGATNGLYSVSFTDANNGFAVGGGGIILKTTNGGTTWSTQTSGTTNELDGVSFTDANNGTAVGGGATILRTTNGGTTWTAQSSPSGTGGYLFGVCFTDVNNGTIVGGFYGPSISTILRTTNGGTTWTSQTSGITTQLLAVSFTDVNNGTAVSGYDIIRTTNGGSTWTLQSSGATNDLYSVSFTDANNGFAVGVGGIILKTTNGGAIWSKQSEGTTNHLSAVSFTDANNGTAVGEGAIILRTINGGTTWALQSSGTTYYLQGVSFTDANNGMAVGSSGTILRTTNAGTTWTSQTTGTTNDLYGVSFTDAVRGTVVGASGTILRTTNGGTGWTAQTSGTTNDLYGVSFTEANSGTAVGTGGTILRTTDGGTTWTTQTSGTTNYLYSVSFTDANNGTVVGSDYTNQLGIILRTTNGGTTWSLQSNGTTNLLYGVSFSDANNGTAVGEGGTILTTTDGGTTWTSQSSGTTNSLYGVSFTNANNGSAVGIWGTILRTTNGTLDVQFPNGGESWQVGTTQNITWTSSGITDVKLEYTTNGGTNWSTIIASTPASAGSYAWTIPNTPSIQCKVKVSDATNSAVSDISDNAFTISALSLSSPIGGENWQIGTTKSITWTSGNVTNVKLEYTINNGTSWQTIIESTSASAGSYSWSVPNTPSTNCKVRISSGTIVSISLNVFTIHQPVKMAIGIHQNPVVTKFANIIVATESPLKEVPFVSVKSSLDSVEIPMALVANSSTDFSGSYVFKTSSSITIFTRITTETGVSKDSSRMVNVILAKPDAVTAISSLDKKALLTINPKTVDEETFFISGVENENGEQVFSFSPGVTFNNKLNLEISYSMTQFTDVSKLFIYQEVDNEWVPIRSQVYPVETKVKAYVETLGKFKIAADPSFEGDNRVPESFALKQNYPNPFNPTTTLQYDLPENDYVSLVIYSILGKQVATLVNGYQLAGTYNFTWEAKNELGIQLSSGIYFYQIRTSKFSQVKKMILMR